MLTSYQRYHLKPVFETIGVQMFEPIVSASLAHVVMLVETGVLPQPQGGALARALLSLRDLDPQQLTYSPDVEDMYFWIERELANRSSLEVAGNLQLARSRNDLDAGVFRIVVRARLLALIEAMARACRVVTVQAAAFKGHVVVGYTHRQPAQPTTIGHVMAGYADSLLEDIQVLAGLYGRVNQCPLGGCAFAGTDLPIDRERLKQWLGFDSMVENTYEAIAGASHYGLVAGAVATAVASGARFSRTLLDWLAADRRWLYLPDEWVQISSIMPQKRNPVVMEHLIALAGDMAGLAASVLAKIQDSHYEDTDIGTTDVQGDLWKGLDKAHWWYVLFTDVVQALQIGELPQPDEMIRQYVTTTRLADAMAMTGVPFRTAHQVVTELVRGRKPPDAWSAEEVNAAYLRICSHPLPMDGLRLDEMIREALDPLAVRCRPTLGGPGEPAVAANTGHIEAGLDALEGWLARSRQRLAAAQQELELRAAQLASISTQPARQQNIRWEAVSLPDTG